MTQTLTPIRTIVVPGWILRSLLRNKLNTIDLLDFSKVRPVLSIDDMAEWFYLNDRFTINNCRLSTDYLEGLWHSFSPEGKLEIQNSVLPLSGSEEIASSANQKLLAKTDNVSNPVGNPKYQFIRIENILYIILSEGFMSSLLEPAATLEFVKNYLKEHYAMASVADVSKHGMFNLYLKQFAISAT